MFGVARFDEALDATFGALCEPLGVPFLAVDDVVMALLPCPEGGTAQSGRTDEVFWTRECTILSTGHTLVRNEHWSGMEPQTTPTDAVYTVYIANHTRTGIDPGSGIVGEELPDGRISVHFEGNRYGAVNLSSYLERLDMCSSRRLTRYPTVAMRVYPAGDLTAVGAYYCSRRVLTLFDVDAASTWSGEQLHTTNSLKHPASHDGE